LTVFKRAVGKFDASHTYCFDFSVIMDMLFAARYNRKLK